MACRAPKLDAEIRSILREELEKWEADHEIGVALAGQNAALDAACDTPTGECDRHTLLRDLAAAFDGASAHRVMWTLRGTPPEHWLYGPLVEDAVF
jgi:hypothetical protein